MGEDDLEVLQVRRRQYIQSSSQMLMLPPYKYILVLATILSALLSWQNSCSFTCLWYVALTYSIFAPGPLVQLSLIDLQNDVGKVGQRLGSFFFFFYYDAMRCDANARARNDSEALSTCLPPTATILPLPFSLPPPSSCRPRGCELYRFLLRRLCFVLLPHTPLWTRCRHAVFDVILVTAPIFEDQQASPT